MNIIIRSVLSACLLLIPLMACSEDMVVVGNLQNGVSRLSRTEVVNIFLGRYRQLSSGVTVQPVDLPPAYPEKARFYRFLVNKDLAEINSYWARLVFSGRIAPPIEARSHEDLLNIIGRTPGAIGYMDRSKFDARAKLDARIKLVYTLEP